MFWVVIGIGIVVVVVFVVCLLKNFVMFDISIMCEFSVLKYL